MRFVRDPRVDDKTGEAERENDRLRSLIEPLSLCPRNLFNGRGYMQNRGLSQLQTSILLVLPAQSDKPILIKEIFERLGIEHPTIAQRGAMSRSLAKLLARGLIDRYIAERRLAGNGGYWSRST
jgi:hypothetical protein